MGNCLSSGLVGLDWMSLEVFSDLNDSVIPGFLHDPQHIHIPWAWPLEAQHLTVLLPCALAWSTALSGTPRIGAGAQLGPWMGQLVPCIQLGKEPGVLLLAPEAH